MSTSTRVHGVIKNAGTVELEVMDCPNCGVVFGVTQEYAERRRADKRVFYCPNQHQMSYSESDADRLRKEKELLEWRLAAKEEWSQQQGQWLRQERERHARTQRQLSATKGVVTRTKKRVAAGVCPCCNRTFQQLARHMSGQHPDYVQQPE